MTWKKIADSQELLVFEKYDKDHKLKIEARKNNDGWEVFMTRLKGDTSNLLSEYFLDSKRQVLDIVEKLKKQRPRKKIRDYNRASVSVKRAYKEEFVEKWYFTVAQDSVKNVLFIKFDAPTQADIILHERYRRYESNIVDQLEDKLGLSEASEVIQYHTFYFRHQSGKEKMHQSTYFDIEFDFSPE